MAHSTVPLSLVGLTARNLYRQPVRTTLTVVGVSVGVMAMVALNTTARGLKASLDTAINTADADFLVYQSGVAADIFSRLEEDKIRDALLADPDVEAVAGGLFHPQRLPGFSFALSFGIHRDEFIRGSAQILDGRRLEEPNEVVLGTIAARMLKKGPGDTIVLGGEEFTVTGIFQTDIVFFDGSIVMLLPKLQEMVGIDGQVTLFLVRVRDGADVKAVADRIERGIKGIATITDASDYQKIDQGLVVMDATVWVISMLTVLVGGIIVMNTMWMTVLERTREIGVLRAVGWSRKRITLMILAEAVGVGILASIVGSLAGVGLAQLSTLLPITSQFNDPRFDLPPFVMAFCVALTLSVLGAWLPALRATQVSPVEALRYE
jgi:putative ABC transport system permease protein